MIRTEAWLYAATWGSYMTGGDPGACMYGFDERFTVQSEEHRAACLRWIDEHCVPAVKRSRETIWVDLYSDYDDDELDKLAELRSMVEQAEVA